MKKTLLPLFLFVVNRAIGQPNVIYASPDFSAYSINRQDAWDPIGRAIIFREEFSDSLGRSYGIIKAEAIAIHPDTFYYRSYSQQGHWLLKTGLLTKSGKFTVDTFGIFDPETYEETVHLQHTPLVEKTGEWWEFTDTATNILHYKYDKLDGTWVHQDYGYTYPYERSFPIYKEARLYRNDSLIFREDLNLLPAQDSVVIKTLLQGKWSVNNPPRRSKSTSIYWQRSDYGQDVYHFKLGGVVTLQSSGHHGKSPEYIGTWQFDFEKSTITLDFETHTICYELTGWYLFSDVIVCKRNEYLEK